MESKQCNTNGRNVWSTKGRDYVEKLFWSHSKRVSSSAYPLFSQPSYIQTCSSTSGVCIIYEGVLKILYNDISVADNFFDQWDPSTATLMEIVCGSQGKLCWKINLIWSHSLRVSWSTYKLLATLYTFL